jgi:phage terminase small subunit
MMATKQFQRARAVLKSLIQGLDPETGAELPKDAVVNRIEVNRSMLVAIAAMEQVEARMLRRALLPESVGKTWTETEEQQLKDEFARSEPIPVIAKKHQRTVRAIEARLERMGLLRNDQRTTDDSFLSPPSGREE